MHLQPGQQLRRIIQVAIERRRILRLKNVSRLPQHEEDRCMRVLASWLPVNPWPSLTTVAAFPYTAELSMLIPSNAEGKLLLAELHRLLNSPR
jgi:hypothetical protein